MYASTLLLQAEKVGEEKNKKVKKIKKSLPVKQRHPHECHEF